VIIETFEKIATCFEKIDFLNFFVRYEKIPVTKVLNIFEHLTKKFAVHTTKTEKSNFKKSALSQTLQGFHKLFKISSEISDVSGEVFNFI